METNPIIARYAFGDAIFGIFPTELDAAKAIGVSAAEIHKALVTGNIVNHYTVGYYYAASQQEIRYRIKCYDANHNCIGQWHTILEAAEATGLHRNTISRYAKSGQQDMYGRFWEKLPTL